MLMYANVRFAFIYNTFWLAQNRIQSQSQSHRCTLALTFISLPHITSNPIGIKPISTANFLFLYHEFVFYVFMYVWILILIKKNFVFQLCAFCIYGISGEPRCICIWPSLSELAFSITHSLTQTLFLSLARYVHGAQAVFTSTSCSFLTWNAPHWMDH